MSLFGKILVVLNLLAVVALAYVAWLDSVPSRVWAQTALLLDRREKGIPVDGSEKDVQGNFAVDDLDDSTLNKAFEGVDGTPFKEQVDEVRRLRAELQKQIDSSASKSAELARILLPFAGTNDRRKALLKRLTDGKDAKADDLQADFNRIFEDALREHFVDSAGKQRKRDTQEWHMAIAALAVGVAEYLHQQEEAKKPRPATDPGESASRQFAEKDRLLRQFDSKAYRRFLRVVGTKAMSEAVDRQSATREQIVSEVKREMDSALSKFKEEHMSKLADLKGRARELENKKRELQQQLQRVQEQEPLVEEQRQVVQKVTEKLLAAERKCKKLLLEQAKDEAEIFKLLEYYRDALGELLELERQLRDLELGRP